MKKYKIFVSGVQKELPRERQAVKELIIENILLKEHFDVFLFEDHPAEGKSANKVYIDKVTKSDIYIGILGKKYGYNGADKISPTEKEFRSAKNSDKEILIYIKGTDDSKRDTQLKKLINEIKKVDEGYKYRRFKDIAELKTNIFESLVTFLQEKNIITKMAFDMSICEESTYKDINEEKLKWFLETAQAKRDYPADVDSPVKEIITHLNLLKDNRLTNASILLFGKNPQKFHLQVEVKCIHFHGAEVEKPFESYHIYKSDIFDQVDNALGFVLDRLKRPVIPEPGKAATKRPFEIPEFVIREAIVNAVAHRDYYSSAGVQVMVFIDRIEVWNPGKLPPQLTIESLKQPHPSFPYNPLIWEPLYLAKYAEKAGSGTVEIIKQCKESGLPEPEFIQKMGHFVTVLWRDIFTDTYLSELGLNVRQLKAVKYIKEKGKITNKEYKYITGISKPMATIDLKKLVEKNIFKKLGVTGRGTEYILLLKRKG